jgi:RimJ/RimL family protein N-acetyltransferase
MTAFPDSFTTPRLAALRLQPRHYDDLRRLQTDASYMAQLGGVRTDEQTRAYLATNLDHWSDHGFGLWMLTARDDVRPIGVAVLRHLEVDGADEVEVGYGFLPECWGQGLATEIATACLAFGFDTFGLPSLVAVTTPEHQKSQRVLLTLGFAYERDIDLHDTRLSLFRIHRP